MWLVATILNSVAPKYHFSNCQEALPSLRQMPICCVPTGLCFLRCFSLCLPAWPASSLRGCIWFAMGAPALGSSHVLSHWAECMDFLDSDLDTD